MNADLFFSSKSDLWSTPQELFDGLDREFHFDIDVCATPENAKCARYFTEEQDGLTQTWSGTVWCNPPYGKTISKWIQKGAESAENGATVVMLLPVRTNTNWFHDLVYEKAEIRFIRGKLKFGGFHSTAPFPSMVVIFRPTAAVEMEGME